MSAMSTEPSERGGHLGTMNCPVCPATNIPADCLVCENCGTDLAPIRRVRELAAWHYNAALALVGHDDNPAAIRELQAALSADSSSVPVRILLGKVLWKMGRTCEALDEWRRVASEHPDDANVKSLLAEANQVRARRSRTLPIVVALGTVAIAILSFATGRMTSGEHVQVSEAPSTLSTAAVPESQPETPPGTGREATVTVSGVISESAGTPSTLASLASGESATVSEAPSPAGPTAAVLSQTTALPEAESKMPVAAPESSGEPLATSETAASGERATISEAPSVLSPVAVPDFQPATLPETTQAATAAVATVIHDLSTLLEAVDGLRVEYLNGVIRATPVEGLFLSGAADPHPRGAALLRSIANALREAKDPMQVRIVGFTDVVPPQPGGRWVENWQLALYRSASAVAAMRGETNQHEWLASIGDERHAPCPNDSDANRRCNRTVVVEIRAASDSR